jgi:hypothetical protein
MKRIFPFFFCLVFSIFATAQIRDTSSVGFFTTKYSDNWFVSFGGGANLYLGTQDAEYLSTYSFAPSGEFNFGKWFTPSVGFRVQINGGQGYGWSTSDTPYSHYESGIGLYMEKFTYGSSHVDILWNVLDMGDNYRYSKLFRLIPFVGAGAAMTMPHFALDSAEVAIAASAGFIFNFRITEGFSIYSELRSVFSDGRLDKVYGEAIVPKIEMMTSISVGVQIEISPAKFVRKNQMESDYRYNEKILKQDIVLLKSKLKKIEEERNVQNALNIKLLKRLEELNK